MVRFIAAITLISVCCQSSVVHSQTKSFGKRPVAPVSRTQTDDSPSRAQNPLGNQQFNQGVEPEIPPELEQLLIDWAASSEKIERLEGEHLRRVYDLPFEVEKLSQGRFYYETPDKGRINITPVQITPKMIQQRANGEVPSKKRKDGKPFDLKSDQEECWSCDGFRVYEMDIAKKEARIAQLPHDMQGKNIMDSPLPFLFGMPPAKAKQRFQMSLLRPIDARSGHASLHILPRLPQDAASWASADVILDLKTFLPSAVQLVDPAGTKITVYSFTGLKVNENKWIDKWFDSQDPKTRFTPDLRGFKVILSDSTEQAQNDETLTPDTRGLNAQNEGDADPIKTVDQGTAERRPKATPNQPGAQQKKEAVLVNVRGMLHSDAVIQLERQGLKRIKEDENANDIILERGPAAEKEEDVFTVKSQDPPAGTPLKKGMKVRLTIWTKPGDNAKQ